MHHSYIDKYSELESPLHSLDPRAKIIFALVITLCIVLASPIAYFSFASYALLVLILIFLSRIPPGTLLSRALFVVPFAALIAFFVPFTVGGEVLWSFASAGIRLTVTTQGLILFISIMIKSFLALLCLAVFISSTRYSVFLKALGDLKVPALFVMILSFMYRYLFVIVDELMLMKAAKDSRTVGGTRFMHLKAAGGLAGTLFLRSYERGERVYKAMLSRGFCGNAKTVAAFRLKRVDFAFSAALTLYIAATYILEGHHGAFWN